MSKTFSDEQIRIIKHLMDLQMDIDNRIKNKIQENFLRCPMDNKTIKEQLDSLKDSIEYTLDETISIMKANIQ